MQKPLLFLSTRPETEIATHEAEAFARHAGVTEANFHWHRLEQQPLPEVDLAKYSGVILGGSPFNMSNAQKSALQQRVEADIFRLLDQMVAQDFPFLGACYGIGALCAHQGGVVDTQYGESAGLTTITVTDDGARDPLLAGVPEQFQAFVGHKEASSQLPPAAVLLAGGQDCPVQMFRLKQNIYATQFHPELDVPGFLLRIEAYQDHGYFSPEELPQIQQAVSGEEIIEPQRILQNFTQRYLA